jgi:hypothetical protein
VFLQSPILASMRNNELIGKQGLVTGTVRPGSFGEVMLPVGNRLEAFYAMPFDDQEVITIDQEVVVIALDPVHARTLLVSAMPDHLTTENN